jgi:lambda family phage minor tail protein L
MVRHLTVATVIEANKIASETAFLELIEVDVKDREGAHVEYLRFCRNSENITFNGNVYQAANFTVSVQQAVNEEPRITFSARDPTGIIRARMEQYGGGVGFEVTYTIVNSARLDAPPEIDEKFLVVQASAPPNYEVNFVLGAENPLRQRFPLRTQYRDRCMWRYKGPRCKYAGDLETCSFTLNGENGCRAHDNVANFGGFPALQNLSV